MSNKIIKSFILTVLVILIVASLGFSAFLVYAVVSAFNYDKEASKELESWIETEAYTFNVDRESHRRKINGRRRTYYEYDYDYAYTVNGVNYEGSEFNVRNKPDDKFTILVNPNNPKDTRTEWLCYDEYTTSVLFISYLLPPLGIGVVLLSVFSGMFKACLRIKLR